jgi:hypothetical protein
MTIVVTYHLVEAPTIEVGSQPARRWFLRGDRVVSAEGEARPLRAYV